MNATGKSIDQVNGYLNKLMVLRMRRATVSVR